MGERPKREGKLGVKEWVVRDMLQTDESYVQKVEMLQQDAREAAREIAALQEDEGDDEGVSVEDELVVLDRVFVEDGVAVEAEGVEERWEERREAI